MVEIKCCGNGGRCVKIPVWGMNNDSIPLLCNDHKNISNLQNNGKCIVCNDKLACYGFINNKKILFCNICKYNINN